MDEELKRAFAKATDEMIRMSEDEFCTLLDAAKQSDLYQVFEFAGTQPPRLFDWSDHCDSHASIFQDKISIKEAASDSYGAIGTDNHLRSSRIVMDTKEAAWTQLTAA